MKMNPHSPPQIHKLLMEHLILKEIAQVSEGISGYKLRKRVNKKIHAGIDESSTFKPPKLSQSLVYRILNKLKDREYISEKNAVINNRYQNLYNINDNGRARLESILKIIHQLFPRSLQQERIIEDFFKLSPLELIPPDYPKERLLKDLKQKREHLKSILIKIESKINELEAELSQ